MSKQYQHPSHLPPVMQKAPHPILNGAIMRRLVKLTGFVHGEVILLATDGVPAVHIKMPLRAIGHFMESIGAVYVNDMLATLNAPGECAVLQMPADASADIDLTLPANAGVAEATQGITITLFDQKAIDGVLLGTGDKYLGKTISLGEQVPATEEDRARAALDLAREQSLQQAADNANPDSKLSVVEDVASDVDTTSKVADETAATELTQETLPQEAQPVLSAEAGHDASESTATLKEEV